MLSETDLERAKFLLYNEKVRKLSEDTFKREWFDNKKLRGQNWHLEHKLSIKECYDCQVPVEIASHVCNLEVVSKEYNLAKGRKSSLTFTELLELVANYEDSLD